MNNENFESNIVYLDDWLAKAKHHAARPDSVSALVHANENIRQDEDDVNRGLNDNVRTWGRTTAGEVVDFVNGKLRVIGMPFDRR